MTTKKTTKKAGYKAELKMMGKPYTGKGETILDAVTNIDIKAVAGVCVLKITGDGTEKTRILPANLARKAFTTAGMTRDVQLKQLSLMFQGI